MDLGIRGRWAILAGSSRGLGRACAESIAREGVNVVINGRTQEDVDVAVAELTSHYGVEARGVVGDSATSSVQDALMAACSEPDIVLLNGQGPSPKGFLDIEIDDWDSAVRQALTGPLALVPNSLMSLSHGTRLGLTGVLKGLSKDLAKYNVTVNQLLPERFDTARQEQMAHVAMKILGITYEEARAQQIASIKAGRLGRPDEFGDAFAFLCAAQAGYISGQNLQLDGGSYEGVF